MMENINVLLVLKFHVNKTKCSSTYFKVLKKSAGNSKSPGFRSFISNPSKANNFRVNKTLDIKRKKSNEFAKKRKSSKGTSVVEMDSFLAKVNKNQTFDFKPKAKEVPKPNDNQNSSVILCLICFDNSPNAVIMDCGHGGVCYDCAVDILNTQGECFLCRKGINRVLRVEQDMDDSKILKGVEEANLVEEPVDDLEQSDFSFRNPNHDLEDSHLNTSNNKSDDNSFEDNN